MRWQQRFLRRRRTERQLDAELRFHWERQYAAHVAAGLSPEEAARRTRLEFGGLDQVKEQCRDVGDARWLEALWQDVRYGLRQLGRNAAFTAVAVFVLGVGICAALALFAFADAALLQPLPYAQPSRLVEVTETVRGLGAVNLSYPDFQDWKRINRVFSSMAVWVQAGFLLGSADGAQPEPAARVSVGFFRTLGVQPLLGRGFLTGEDLPGAPHTVLLSYGAWQKWFGGSKSVVGRTAELSGNPYTIIGVLPRSFQFAPTGGAKFWIALQPDNSCEQRRSCHDLIGIARLKDGITVAAALADVQSIAAELTRRYPDSNRGQGGIVLPLTKEIVGAIRPVLWTLLGAAVLLLLIACINVACMLLVRSESRRREIAVRGALGASRGRLARQFATEGLLLVAAGMGVGLGAAAAAMPLLLHLIPAPMRPGMPFLDHVSLNPPTLAFAAAIAVFAAVLFAVIPLCRLPRVREGLAASSRSSAGVVWRRLGANLVVAELAVAVVLLVGAGLLGTSLYRLLRVQLGFQADHLALMEVSAPGSSNGTDAREIALGRKLQAGIAAVPGVHSVAITTRQLPVSFNGNTDWVRFVGRPYNGVHNEVNERDVSANYFTTLGAHLLRGRYFTNAEDESKPGVAIINTAFAEKYFPGQDPIGQKFGDTKLSPKSLRTIVGVVANIREGSLDSAMWPTEYLPFNQSPDAFVGVIARTSLPPQLLLPAMAARVRKVAPGLGIALTSTMHAWIDDSGTAYLDRSAAWMVGGFALLALLLG
ncbi:MAG: ADOP family duplicated permease, partial [Terriglobales bacterium]